jgi:hypothetical protein
MIGLDNYCSSLELFDLLNESETDKIGTIRSNREKTYKRHQGKEIKTRRNGSFLQKIDDDSEME